VARLAPTLLVAFLLAGTAVAFAVTQGLKLEKSPIYGTVFDEVLGPSQPAWLRFRLRKGDTVTVTVVDASGHAVRTLRDHQRRRPGRIKLTWDGRTDAGAVAPEGRYRLRVRLADRRRTILIPTSFTLDSTPPTFAGIEAAPRVFSPDRDGHADRVNVRYRTNEAARVVLTVNGRRAGLGKFRDPTVRSVSWVGKVDGTRLPPGRYVLRLRAEDRAGNPSAPTRALAVRLRYVELRATRLIARAGKRFRVPLDTDARTVRWRIAGRSDLGQARSLRIRAPAAPGRYRLYVTANGHADTAFVVVRPPK
jgi:hypothetical protein